MVHSLFMTVYIDADESSEMTVHFRLDSISYATQIKEPSNLSNGLRLVSKSD